MASSAPIRIAILWHMHQPNYREPNANRLAMPWVRLHALKDYLDMPLRAARFESIRVTFNLVPSLIDQLELYLNGGTDRHLELSRVPAEQLSPEQRREILETFFVGNPTYMIEPFARYRALHKKATGNGNREHLASLFSSSEIRDLQVWSNLSWVDPMFRDEEPVRQLFAKGRHFTEEEKLALLDWELELIMRIVPTYRQLLETSRIEVSFTPYYHPILPLLCDTESALEALPSLKLPQKRFRHPEDAREQIRRSIARFKELFGRELTGMWPSEGSVSEQALELIREAGIIWAASDQGVLRHSLTKSGQSPDSFPLHSVYEHNGLKLFFRDQGLSDRIGFVYSGWPADRAVADFIGHIKTIRKLAGSALDRTVVPIILDGENAWEYFPGDGTEFLDTLYREIERDPEIETLTLSEAAREIPAYSLPSINAGSWINHNFRIWIGHEEDNRAWDLLTQARDRLVAYLDEHPDFPEDKKRRAWEQIYIAEGSDWNWWYGDEHRGHHNEQFDQIFRSHLVALYEILELEIPNELLRPIHGGGATSYTVMPDQILTIRIDGRRTHFYEWTGAGYFDCVKAGGAMHRAEHHISGIHFAFDHNRCYIRLDFKDRKSLDLIKEARIVVDLITDTPRQVEIKPADGLAGEQSGEYQYAIDAIAEIALERAYIWPDGAGEFGFTVALYDGDQKIESWPEHEPIQLTVPEKDREMFWPM